MKHYSNFIRGLFICVLSLLFFQPTNSQTKRCGLEPCMERIKITSPAFNNFSAIPTKYVYTDCNGQNKSPALSWSKLPDCTKSIVIIVEDPDAPSPRSPRATPWVHWIIYDLPTSVLSLAEGASISDLGGKQGRNDFGNSRYDGPCPPAGSGKHRYFFKIYALNIESLGLPAGSTPNRQEILTAMENHVFCKGELIGTYEINS